MNTVSILIPCYNDEVYVGTAIESALKQTWPACEIIVVDDGSTDDSFVVARQYESEGVQVIKQPNRGAAAARNTAFNAATGHYIQYLDSDDLLHPQKIEAQVKVLEDSPLGCIAVTPTCYFEDGEDPDSGQLVHGEPSLVNSDDPVQWLVNLWTPGVGWGMVQPGAWLSPSSIIEEAGPWNEVISPDDDGEFFTRVLLKSRGIRYTEDGWVYYRKQSANNRLSGLRSRAALNGWIQSIDSKRDHMLPLITNKQLEHLAHGLARQYWTAAMQAYPAHPDIASKAEARSTELGFPDPLHPISNNGWKARVARSVQSLVGWRAARWCQVRYHQLRRTIT